MIDVKSVRDDPGAFKAGLARKNADPLLVDELLAVDERRRSLQTRVDALRAQQKEAGRGLAAASPQDRDRLREELGMLKAGIGQIEDEYEVARVNVQALLDEIPNPAHPSVPEGLSDSDNVCISTHGEPTVPEPCVDHETLEVRLGIVDKERAAKVSGARFAYLLGDGARLQMALERLAVDVLTPKGFVPARVPVLVRESAMYGTGFFPTDRAQIYATDQDDLFLVGTSEVPLAAFHGEEILDAASLPLRYLGFSTCFRREAGTYGKDTKGIFRVHQFDKVEMFSFCHPDESWAEHDFLLACEREIYDSLELAYRVVNVCGGDLGAPAAKKYDIEAWLPSEGRYREVTSTSNTTDYQARRLRVRMRDSGGLRVLHTLNGTAIAIGRAITFLLEQHQQPDGTVRVPAVLVDRGAPEVLRPVS